MNDNMEEKRMAGDYEIIQAVQIGDREVVLGENPQDETGMKYMCAFCRQNALFAEYSEVMASDDFPEIVELFGQRVAEQAQKTHIELNKPRIQGIDDRPITAEGCIPISYEDDLHGKIVVIKPEVLRREYRRATRQLNKFSFAYDSNTFGIHDIDLTIQEGEFIVLTGKSGCGKTTLTRCINGLIPDFFEGTITGSCRVCGMDISEHETGDYSSYVGSVFQDPRSQFFTLHVKTEIPFPSENLGTPSSVIQDRFRNTVKQLNISNLLKKSIFELSSGEKQKVAIASIYTANVQIYVLDEPSANLDWEGTKQLKKLLGQLKEQGCTIIISEHKLYYLKDLADRVVILKDGQINTILSGNEFKAQSTNWFHDNGLRQVNLKDIVCNPASVKAATREQVSVR